MGAIAGGLLDNEVARRGDKTEGTIIGGAVGALAGRAIDRSDGRRC
ncbi:glycine zipper 2TM domain-containing protein [Stenotrophomonas maltophilia]